MIEVAIVGAGAAGIGAARILAASGRDVLLVEASDRIGGRAATVRVADMPLDLGCGWLHSADRNPWVAIAAELGMQVDRTPTAWGEQWRDLGFSAEDQHAAAEAYAAFEHRLRTAPPASDRAVDALLPGGPWNGHIEALSGYINGVGLSGLSVADYLAYDDAATDANWRVPDGYGTLVARGCPRVPIAFGTPVHRIALDGPGVTLDTPAGTIRARKAIVTVPTTMLANGRLRLPPALDDHAHAASRLPLGLADKLFLTLPGGVVDEADRHLLGQPRRAATGSYYLRPFGRPVVECFFGGEGARMLGAGGTEGAATFARTELAGLLGSAAVRDMRTLAASAWGRADGFGGSYSHALPGHAAARLTLARPYEDRLFFAGEACSPTDFSTAHGALQTGIDAANAVNRLLG